MVKVNPDEIKLLSKFIHEISGIAINASKAYLLETRLGKLLEMEGCRSYAELHQKARQDSKKLLEKKIIDAITTNETLFFRDANPFELLQHKILPEIIDARNSKAPGTASPILRIWSAACSTGQEVYSIAIVLKELLLDVKKYNIKLLGTDLSDAAIMQASAGQYNKFEIERGLKSDKLQRYFTASGPTWKIKEEIRAMATFKRFNLLGSLSGLGKFDIIFCRNVAIYFNLDDRKRLFERIADLLEPDGYLIIGSTESLMGICARFVPKKHLKSIFYQLK